MTVRRLLPRLAGAAALRRRCCWLLGAWRAAEKGLQPALHRAAAILLGALLPGRADACNCNAAGVCVLAGADGSESRRARRCRALQGLQPKISLRNLHPGDPGSTATWQALWQALSGRTFRKRGPGSLQPRLGLPDYRSASIRRRHDVQQRRRGGHSPAHNSAGQDAVHRQPRHSCAAHGEPGSAGRPGEAAWQHRRPPPPAPPLPPPLLPACPGVPAL